MIERTISGTEFLLIRGPCVYAWIRGNKWLYVGASSTGIIRPLRHNIINAIEPIQPIDEVRLYYFESMDEASTFEVQLMTEMLPKYNYPRPEVEISKTDKTKLICQSCEKEFSPRRFWQRFCSNACRISTHKIKHGPNKKWKNKIQQLPVTLGGPERPFRI